MSVSQSGPVPGRVSLGGLLIFFMFPKKDAELAMIAGFARDGAVLDSDEPDDASGGWPRNSTPIPTREVRSPMDRAR